MTVAKIGTVLVILVLGGLVVASYRWRTSEKIEKINVRGMRMLTEQEIINDAQVALGANLSDVDLKTIRARLQENPFIARTVINRDREALDIDVTERAPIARVDIDGTLSLIDTGGVIFPQRAGMMLDVPVVYGITKTLDGANMIDTAAVREVVSVIRSARALNAKALNAISVVRRLPTGEIQFETNDGAVPVRFGTPDDEKEKIAAFCEFLPQLMLHGAERAQYIDVRFHDQVVIRWKDSLGLN